MCCVDGNVTEALATISSLVGLELRGAIAWLIGRNPPVNVLSRPVREGLIDGMQAASSDPRVETIVVRCEGRTFFSGADLAELDAGLAEPGLLDFVKACETSARPVIAALHGTVFGGGVVVAYACDHRIASEGTRFAMPEVALGLLPTFGGTQYLPRLVGAERALDLLIDGRILSADEALACGLIDEVVGDGELDERARSFAEASPPKRLTRDLPPPPVEPLRTSIARRRARHRARHPEFEAPEVCLDIVERGLRMPLDEALAMEHDAFLRLLASPQSQRLRMLFFADRVLARCTFDRDAVAKRLRDAKDSPGALSAVASDLCSSGMVPDPHAMEALVVQVFGLPRHRPSLLDPGMAS